MARLARRRWLTYAAVLVGAVSVVALTAWALLAWRDADAGAGHPAYAQTRAACDSLAAAGRTLEEAGYGPEGFQLAEDDITAALLVAPSEPIIGPDATAARNSVEAGDISAFFVSFDAALKDCIYVPGWQP